MWRRCGACSTSPGSFTVNLGTGRGQRAGAGARLRARASGRAVPYEIVARRPGDVAACYADPALAEQLLGWQARGLTWRACARTAGAGKQINPNGFDAA
jgi:UDP-glucose 4-epimerase